MVRRTVSSKVVRPGGGWSCQKFGRSFLIDKNKRFGVTCPQPAPLGPTWMAFHKIYGDEHVIVYEVKMIQYLANFMLPVTRRNAGFSTTF